MLDNRADLANQFDYDWHARQLTFEPHFRALLLHQVTDYESARDLRWAAENDILFESHQADFEVSVPGFTGANAERPLEPFLIMLQPGPVADGYTVHEDRYVILTGADRWYRCLRVQLTANEEITILTYLLWLSAEQICLLYRYRRKIEIIFRWLKSLLELDHWISRDPRGIIRQVLTALIVWGWLIVSR